MNPPDETTVNAFVTILQTGVVGAVLVLIIGGVFRLAREVKREEKATADAEAREDAANARADKMLEQLERVSEGVDRLVTAIDKLAMAK